MLLGQQAARGEGVGWRRLLGRGDAVLIRIYYEARGFAGVCARDYLCMRRLLLCGARLARRDLGLERFGGDSGYSYARTW